MHVLLDVGLALSECALEDGTDTFFEVAELCVEGLGHFCVKHVQFVVDVGHFPCNFASEVVQALH